MAPSKPAPSVNTLLSQLRQGDLQPCYVLYGDETFLIRRALERFKTRVVPPDDDLAYVALRGEDVRGQDIARTARTVPMLSEQQLVVVRNADVLKSDDLAALLTYVKSPAPTTCLVLVVTKLDRRFKFFDYVARQGWAYQAQALTAKEAPRWIGQRARARGLQLSPEAAQVLADTAGTDLSLIEDALERLTLFVGEQKEATVDDIEAVVSSSRVRSVFELTDALGQRDLGGALRTLHHILEQGDQPLRLAATLATHLRRLLLAAELGPGALNDPHRLTGPLGVPPFIARKLASQARHFSRRELRQALVRCADTDLELKGAKRPDKLILEQLIIELCGTPRNQTNRRPS
jgi:DNA polymerase-3 subunit delta